MDSFTEQLWNLERVKIRGDEDKGREVFVNWEAKEENEEVRHAGKQKQFINKNTKNNVQTLQA